MKTIIIHQQKGGVGKSTIAANIAFSLGKKGKKVCIVDAGMGCISLIHLKENYKYEITDVLKSKSNLDKTLIKMKDILYIFCQQNMAVTN
jgi:septum formation inhibitor-activating ATPase MinD